MCATPTEYNSSRWDARHDTAVHRRRTFDDNISADITSDFQFHGRGRSAPLVSWGKQNKEEEEESEKGSKRRVIEESIQKISSALDTVDVDV